MNESHWEYDYIHMEVFSGTMPTIEQTGYLLDNGADINAMDENGHTALYSSIECECHYDFEKVKYLLSRGASTKCCLLYTSPSPRDLSTSRMPSSA